LGGKGVGARVRRDRSPKNEAERERARGKSPARATQNHRLIRRANRRNWSARDVLTGAPAPFGRLGRRGARLRSGGQRARRGGSEGRAVSASLSPAPPALSVSVHAPLCSENRRERPLCTACYSYGAHLSELSAPLRARASPSEEGRGESAAASLSLL